MRVPSAACAAQLSLPTFCAVQILWLPGTGSNMRGLLGPAAGRTPLVPLWLGPRRHPPGNFLPHLCTPCAPQVARRHLLPSLGAAAPVLCTGSHQCRREGARQSSKCLERSRLRAGAAVRAERPRCAVDGAGAAACLLHGRAPPHDCSRPLRWIAPCRATHARTQAVWLHHPTHFLWQPTAALSLTAGVAWPGPTRARCLRAHPGHSTFPTFQRASPARTVRPSGLVAPASLAT
jgi:hypothetical protein